MYMYVTLPHRPRTVALACGCNVSYVSCEGCCATTAYRGRGRVVCHWLNTWEGVNKRSACSRTTVGLKDSGPIACHPCGNTSALAWLCCRQRTRERCEAGHAVLPCNDWRCARRAVPCTAGGEQSAVAMPRGGNGVAVCACDHASFIHSSSICSCLVVARGRHRHRGSNVNGRTSCVAPGGVGQ